MQKKKNRKEIEEKRNSAAKAGCSFLPTSNRKNKSHEAETTVLATPYHAMTFRLPSNQRREKQMPSVERNKWKIKNEEEDRHERDIGAGVRRLHVETRVTKARPLSREDVRDLLL
jgi:hypothetical protein